MAESILTRKGQITIPKLLRDELGLQPTQRTILDIEGSVAPRHRPENFQETRREVIAERCRARADRP